MNYDNWNILKWNTLFSDKKYLFMESLLDSDCKLIITLFDDKEIRYKVTFNNFPSYRNLLEKYRLNLWGKIDWNIVGNSWIVENSNWLNFLNKSEPLITHHEENLKHYVICTESDVVEVLSSDENPIIEILK